ncbi:hypothetical protein [Pseudoalteromonas phage Pq0]|uniref:hypothetical protein n=1 Tax=Pseudoalteromonas phage Pq0 TaxID=1667322 RepID=UPI0006550BD1|nr:hypothetical protein AXI74_gp38 [Pseudoalteromonas phage Pq0]AKN44321.1 hypothetical protein [Pseudoalteromonas phage Pq0]
MTRLITKQMRDSFTSRWWNCTEAKKKQRILILKRTMITLQSKGLITFTQTVEKGEGKLGKS